MSFAIFRPRFANLAVSTAVEHQLVEVETHSPDRVIAEPVSTPDHGFSIAENRASDPAGALHQARTDAGKADCDPAKHCGRATFQTVFRGGPGTFVTPNFRMTLRVVRKPVLVGIH